MTTEPRRFVLLDRDGTINEERHYLSDPERFELIPGVGPALGRLRALGLGLVVVTNQSGVARGYFGMDAVDRVHRRMAECLAAAGVTVDGIYICPHGPDDGCDCRKPRPGLALAAAAEHGFDPAGAFVIGDKCADVELGRAIGATTFLVRTGHGREHEARKPPADYVVDDLPEAARRIERLLANATQTAAK